MNIGQFNKAYKGMDFLKGTSAERGLKLVNENIIRKGVKQAEEEITKVHTTIDVLQYLGGEQKKSGE